MQVALLARGSIGECLADPGKVKIYHPVPRTVARVETRYGERSHSSQTAGGARFLDREERLNSGSAPVEVVFRSSPILCSSPIVRILIDTRLKQASPAEPAF
jgi:hypothetical protein